MNSFDRKIYESCKNRYRPDGVHNPTDVETILQMAKEIDKLRADTKALQTDITLLKIEKYSDVFEKPKKPTVHTVHFGDVIVYKQNEDDPYEVAFKITDCIVHMDTESVGTVDLSGVRIRTK